MNKCNKKSIAQQFRDLVCGPASALEQDTLLISPPLCFSFLGLLCQITTIWVSPKNRNLFSHNPGSQTFTIKVSAMLAFSGILEGESASCLFLASTGCQESWAFFGSLVYHFNFCLYHHIAFFPFFFLCVSIFSSYKDTSYQIQAYLNPL